MSHIDDELLAAAALGDDQDLSTAERAHLLDCATCSAAVAELRSLGEELRSTRDEPLSEPTGDLLAVISAATASGRSTRPAREPQTPAGTVVPLPIRRTPTWIKAGAAAAVVGGFLLGRVTAPEPPPQTRVLASVPLDTLDTQHQQLGQAKMRVSNSHMFLDVTAASLPVKAKEMHEVWLINLDGKRMVAVGLLDPDGNGTLRSPSGYSTRATGLWTSPTSLTMAIPTTRATVW